MTDNMNVAIDHTRDLVIERILDVPRELVWRAWTDPEVLKQWFTPAPWTTPECRIDLRPGGGFFTLMRGPEEGQEVAGTGCYLEIVENEKLVWTGALGADFRPNPAEEGPIFTAVVLMDPHPEGTSYRVIAMHPDEASRKAHESMGFHEGWGKALDQMVSVLKRL